MRRKQQGYEKLITRIWSFVTKKTNEIYSAPRERKLYIFFIWIILILISRLFFLQVIEWWYYRQQLSQQHSNNVNITPRRWWVYVTDDAWQSIALAINWDIYNLYIDPKFVWDSEKVSEIITPFLYKHFCEVYWLQKVTKEQCIGNIELFTKSTILPRAKVLYYSLWEIGTGAGYSWLVEQQITVDQENIEIQQQRESIIESFTPEEWTARIKDKLRDLLTPGKKVKNHLICHGVHFNILS